MPIIFAIIVEIYRNQFKRIYLKKQKLFLDILLHFWNLNKILNIVKKKLEPHNLSISKIIQSHKCGCLNVKQVLFRNTIHQSMC